MKKNIVILGAGFGGLRATKQIYKGLKKFSLLDGYQIFLIDKNDFHSFTPLWYEIATTSKQLADNLKLKSLVAYPLAELLGEMKIEIITDEIQKIDLAQGAISLKNSLLGFDYLILAFGTETNYFDIPGLRENSIGFKSFGDTIAARDAIWDAVVKRKDLPSKDLKNLQILIGGGGSTGVEMACEIKTWACELQKELNTSCDIQVTIIELQPRVLASLDERVAKKIEGRLAKLNIKTLTNEKINKVIPKAIVLESGKIIPFDILIWTGGIRVPAIIQKLPLQFDEKMRIKTADTFESLPQNDKTKLKGKNFAIGDISSKGFQVARQAIAEADIAAKNIIEEIKKENGLNEKPRSHIFKSKIYPYVVPAGGKFAIAKFGPFIIAGFPAWILKGIIELTYLISIMPATKAIKIWFRGLFIFIKNDRLG